MRPVQTKNTDGKQAEADKRRNIGERLLLFAIAVPSLIVIIMLPYYHQLPFNVVATVFVGMAAREMAKLLHLLGFRVHVLPAILIGTLLPTVRYLEIMFPQVKAYNAFSGLVVIIALVSLSLPIFIRKWSMKERMFAALGYLIILLYPSFLGTYTVALTSYPGGPLLTLLYIVSVQANDSFAWVFGMLFGKNRGLIDVSPNKSVQGFLGGLITGVIVFVVFALVWPEQFLLSWYLPFLALAIGCSVILGDLVESLMKRAAGVKDSGVLIRGRGGVLDSIDSLLFVAPLYYYFLPFIIVVPV
ncbi:phosphatidate cytidylyltransferase [Candidatus Haliotispira prima]|uniref:Phosphatidate cytidylyltransferase n=1 Tax=Candidatus Haliotispira prima TaxID=3034016 RepID=A0ABY8MGU5_9SPIO|nr:phosphatidate cytidylyltransferase [Candidatus Haliotispira prima]